MAHGKFIVNCPRRSETLCAGSLQAYVYLSLQLLVTACPCALILSTPVTVCR